MEYLSNLSAGTFGLGQFEIEGTGKNRMKCSNSFNHFKKVLIFCLAFFAIDRCIRCESFNFIESRTEIHR